MSDLRPPRRATKVAYRYCSFQPAQPGLTLEDALRRALTLPGNGGPPLSADWRRRRLEMDGAGGEAECLLVNHTRDGREDDRGRSFLFGELVGYRPGSQQALIQEMDGARELNIEALAAPEQRQFLDGMTFWLVRGNHVLVVQGQNSRRRHLEDYLNWLLAVQAGVLPHGTFVALLDKLTLPNGRAAEMPVRSIAIGARTGAVATRSVVVERDHHEQRGAEGTARDRGFLRSILDVVTGDASSAERLLADIPEGEEITVKVLLGFTRRKKTTEEVPIREVAEAVRNLDDADITYQTPNGPLNGDGLRLQHQVRIATIEGLLDREDVLRALVEAYRNFLSNGYLDGE